MRAQTIPGTAAVEAGVAAVQATVDQSLRADFVNAHHIHNYSRTVGSSGGGTGPGSVATLTAYSVQSAAGANNFGNAVEVLSGVEGDFDLPFTISSFDLHTILVAGVSAANRTWCLRFAFSQTKDQAVPHANAAAAVAAKSYSDLTIRVDSASTAAQPVEVMFPRLKRGSKVWVQLKDSTGTGTMGFFFDLVHGYPGTL